MTAARGAQPVRLTVVVRGLNLREETHSAAAEAVQRLVAELLGDPPAAGAAASLATEVLGYWRSQPSCRWAVRVSWTAEVRDAVWRRKYRLAGTGVSISAWSETCRLYTSDAADEKKGVDLGGAGDDEQKKRVAQQKQC